MKGKIVLVLIAAVLIAAQVIFGGKKDAAAKPAATPPAVPQPAAGGIPVPPAASAVPRPAAGDVVAVTFGSGPAAVSLRRSADGWLLPEAGNARADAEKAALALTLLLTADSSPVSPADAPATGLENGGGYPVALELAGGGSYDLSVGLRPAGKYDAAYVRYPGTGDALVQGDIRGGLGLWRNTPEALPERAHWLDKRVLAFTPSEARRLELIGPDHALAFTATPATGWQPEGYVPAGAWSAEGIGAWLEELAALQVQDIAPAAESPADVAAIPYFLGITLADGAVLSVSVWPDHATGGMLMTASGSPGRVFHLPEWRFHRYFGILPLVFPGAAPAFDVQSIRFIDIRHAGETVKMARRDDGWEAVALPYDAKPMVIERLAEMLASLRPEDYAEPDMKRIRPDFGGPMLEVILADGGVHQYRLAGRHPLFPWRYVTVDGALVFSITDAEAAALFPGFADILDLGPVFPNLAPGDVDAVDVTRKDGSPLLTFTRGENGEWSAVGNGAAEGTLPEAERALLADMLALRITGFYDAGRSPGREEAEYSVRVSGRSGVEVVVDFLPPGERDVPYVTDGNRGYLADRAGVQTWLDAVKESGQRLVDEARAKEEAAAAEAEAAAAEAAQEAPPEAEADDVPAEKTAETPDAAALPDAMLEEPAAEQPPEAEAGDVSVTEESGVQEAVTLPDAVVE